MTLDLTAEFVECALGEPGQQWTARGLADLASRSVPEAMLGANVNLLRADVYRLWARWFSETVADPRQFPEEFDYATVYAQTRNVVNELWRDFPEDERNRFAVRLARLRMEELKREEVARQPFSIADKLAVLWAAGPEPRCWICGYRFPGWALEKFEGKSYTFPGPEQFLDRFMPRLKQRHYQIEIDHVVPVHGGGTNKDNLRLACGWCNLAKREMVSVYDVRSHPQEPVVSGYRPKAPLPIWVVRLLATRRRCEWRDGCNSTVENESLTIAPRHHSGVANPINLWVTCRTHDPLGSRRYVSRDRFAV
jgi:hypothetical protein